MLPIVIALLFALGLGGDPVAGAVLFSDDFDLAVGLVSSKWDLTTTAFIDDQRCTSMEHFLVMFDDATTRQLKTVSLDLTNAVILSFFFSSGVGTCKSDTHTHTHNTAILNHSLFPQLATNHRRRRP